MQKYVVDTNIIVQWLLKPDGLAGRIIKSLELELFTPNKAIDELWENRVEWSGKKIDADLEEFISALGEYIVIVDPPYDSQAMRKARFVMEPIDPGDVEFLAVAMTEGAEIWSYDHHFKLQKLVRVVDNLDILKMTPENPARRLILEDYTDIE